MNRTRLAPALCLFLVLLCVPGWAWALTSDRPDAAESSLTVPQYALQVEAGLNVTLVGDFLTEVSSPTKLRFGLLDWVEVHLESPIFNATFVDPNVVDDTIGVANLDLGTKINLYEGTEALPLTVGVLGALTFPTADGADTYALRSLVALDYAFPQWVTLALNLIYTSTLNQEVDQLQTFGYATSLGFTGLSEHNVGLYVEVFGNTGQRTTSPVFGGTGLTYTLSDQVQFDLYGRVGLKDAPEFSAFGGGVSLLFQ